MKALFVLFLSSLAVPNLSAKEAPISVTPARTPAEVGIQRSRERIAKHPKEPAGYNALAMAFARRARETSDVAYYARAEEALHESLSLSPHNFQAMKIQAWLLLGRHEFAKALEVATQLNKQTPDDVTVYGYLADANAELGNYSAAENAAQWMLNLRPGNIAGLTRGAYLRELYGDLPGAIEFMKMAYDATSFGETEDRAWILTQIAHVYLVSGDVREAELYANGALGIFPDYHYALGALAQVRMSQQRYGEAVRLLQRRYAAAPHAENLYALAEALESAGQRQQALREYAEFEQKAIRESAFADNANRELIAYYIDHASRAADALRLAKAEFARRRDVYTLDSYAWALAATGDYSAANATIQQALAVGVKDPKILHHAARIEARLQRTRRELKASSEGPSS